MRLLLSLPRKRKEILANCLTDDERKRTAELIRPNKRNRSQLPLLSIQQKIKNVHD